MPDLRDDLRALAPDLDWPSTPDDLTPALPARRPARTRTPRRTLAIALAVLLALPATALAITPTRHALLDAVGLRHVRVERRTTAPAADPRLGARTTLAGAARAAGFTPRTLTALGPPDAVFARDGIVTLTYDTPRLLLAQARGDLPPRIVLTKVLAMDDHAVRTTVAGAPALFLGADHSYSWDDATGPLIRSGPALIWEAGGLTLRLEGEPSLRAARALAASAR